ncbi:MAG: hypothetical protein J0I93_11320 [Legionella sp.]|mgnify:CR=1 FL=1|nr:hypothetical protein [Legionella sp.]
MRTTQLKHLLAQQHLAGPWFSLNEHLSLALMKRNLTLLRAFTDFQEVSLQEIEQLGEEDKPALIAAQAATQALAPKMKNPAPFFHTLLADSPYVSEIVHDTGQASKRPPANPSVQVTSEAQEPPKASVHGFTLQPGEALASTRYFSPDKHSMAKIIATPTAFEAQYQNLTPDHEIDLAYEISLQYLLNLPPQQKTAFISGPPELVHRVHAAFLTLQHLAHPRFDALTFKLPQGMVAPAAAERTAYCKQHLGTPKEPPRQLTHWQTFLNQKPETFASRPAPLEASVRMPTNTANPLDMARILHASDLSAEDKVRLNEYQRYVQQEWLKPRAPGAQDTRRVMHQHEDFLHRTEAALTLLKKAPSVTSEYQVLRTLYQGTLEDYQNLLEALHQNEQAYEAQYNQVAGNLQRAYRQSFTHGVDHVHKALIHAADQGTLNPEQQRLIQQHERGLQEARTHLAAQSEITQPLRRMVSAQLLQAIETLDALTVLPVDAERHAIKTLAQEQIAAPDECFAPETAHLLQASAAVKQRLTLFKSERQEAPATEVPLDAQAQKLLTELTQRLKCAEITPETEHLRKPWEQLMEQAEFLCTQTQLDARVLETLLTHFELMSNTLTEEPEFRETFEEFKRIMTSPARTHASEIPPDTLTNRML